MLAALRRFAATWPAKVFFIILVASFGLWGVADVARNLLDGTDPNTVARVGSQRVDPDTLQDTSRRVLARVVQFTHDPNPGPEQRRDALMEALNTLVGQAAITGEAARLRVSVPDDALRTEIFSVPGFQGPDHRFNRAIFQSVLRNNGYTEQRYLDLARQDLSQRQVLEAVRAGGTSPDLVNRLAYVHDRETRTADLVTLPFAAAPEPPAPTDAQLERQYDDNADEYRAPEYRRVKVVVLSPESIAHDITPSDADVRTYYETHMSQYQKPALRSVQVVVAQSEAAAKAIATAWIAGADWDAVQKQAAAANASAVELDDTTQAAFPAPDLAAPVFAATPETVTGPVQTASGWSVLRVIKADPGGTQSFEQAREDARAGAALEQASDQVDSRANKVQDALAGGAHLDELPTGLGLTAVTGTMNAQGNTPSGDPAPLPGGPELRQAVIAKAFTTAPTDQPVLENGPGQSYYAVSVDTITPPAQLPLDQVRDRVRDDWLRDARRRAQNEVATTLMTAVNAGKTLAAAAQAAGLPVTHSGPVGRERQPGVPETLPGPLFATPVGRAIMVETATGFTVAVPTAITRPDPAADAAGLARVRDVQAAAVSNDLELTFVAALRAREGVRVNQPLLDSMLQP